MADQRQVSLHSPSASEHAAYEKYQLEADQLPQDQQPAAASSRRKRLEPLGDQTLTCDDQSGKRSRNWIFTWNANRDQAITWPQASVRDPPIHWASAPDFRYMMYQVEFLIVINNKVSHVTVRSKGHLRPGRYTCKDSSSSSSPSH